MTVVRIGGARLNLVGLDADVTDPLDVGGAEVEFDAPGLDLLDANAGDGRHAGRALRVTVYDSSGGIITHLPSRRGVQGSVDLNAPGSGSVSLRAYDDVLADNPDLWADDNRVTVSLGDTAIQTWIMESWGYTAQADGMPELSRTGRGNLSVLDNAVLYPERSLRRTTPEDRYFNFGSKDGDWRKPSEWHKPRVRRFRQSIRYPFPVGWPAKNRGHWLWWKNPDARTKTGPAYFRRTFSLDSDTRVRVWAVGDSDLLLLIDGEPVLRQRADGWRKVKAFSLVLDAGAHTVAARVTNLSDVHDSADDEDRYQGDGADNTKGKKGLKLPKFHGLPRRGGFLLMMASVTKKHHIRKVLLTTSPNGWTVRKALEGPPGWYPAQVLSAFVTEAQDRGVLGMDDITLTFGANRDTSNQRWRRRLSQSYKVGTRGLDLLQQLLERGLDVEMTPDYRLRAWERRGRDLSAAVALDGWVSSSGQGGNPVQNAVLVRSRHGYAEYVASGSITRHGRREGALSAGGASEGGDAKRQAAAFFAEHAQVTATYTVNTTSASGPQPFLDYTVGDIVTAPTTSRRGDEPDRGPVRILSIAYTEGDDGLVEWSHACEPAGA